MIRSLSSLKVVSLKFLIIMVLFLAIPMNMNSKGNEKRIAVKTEYVQHLNDSVVYKKLIEKNVKYPFIVLAQAKIETGNYKSNLCINGNNLFGIKSGKRYAHYNNIDECIDAYLNKIQYKLRNGENYYKFLKRIGYAENPTYVEKVKKMEKTIDKDFLSKII